MLTTYMALAVVLGVSAPSALTNVPQDHDMHQDRAMHKMTTMQVTEMISGWKTVPKEVAKVTMEKYGAPDEVTATRLIWWNNGPWKFTILTNEEIQHNFPMPHKDCLRQGINYKVPENKIGDVLKYDGSVIIDRTPGELSARCDKEEFNMLAVNLAHDVATSKRSVTDARSFYAATAMAVKSGRPNMEQRKYTNEFVFTVMRSGTAFPDRAPRMGR